MFRRTVSEAQILDAVLNGAPKEEVVRVRHAARTDLTAAQRYAAWSRTAGAVQEGAAPLRDAGDRVQAAVLARIAEERGAPLAVVPVHMPAPPRRRWPWAAGLAAVLAVVLAVSLVYRQSLRVFQVREARGGVYRLDPDDRVPLPLAEGDHVRFPSLLETGHDGFSALALPYASELRLEGGARLRLDGARQVYQEAGTVNYRIERSGGGLSAFTVNVSQGRIVDLGTEFEVEVRDNDAAVVRVREGQVRVIPVRGAAVSSKAGEQSILTPVRAVSEPIPAPLSEAERAKLSGDEEPSTPATVSLDYVPETAVLQRDDVLLSLLRSQRTELVAGSVPEGLRKAPPFTSRRPAMGVLAMRSEGREQAIAVACDEKLSGRLRIYFDANVNGDLTDDVMFEEGEDFVPGQSFAAGLLGSNDALWLRCPVRLEVENGEPRAVVVKDQLECTNRRYLRGDVVIPTASKAETKSRSMLLLLDTDSDGDFGDPEGSLGVWAVQSPDDVAPRPLALQPTDETGLFGGYRWRLERNLSGTMVLHGERVSPSDVKTVKMGDHVAARNLETIDGGTVELAAPQDGYLLIYVWSTWYSACQRDIPTGFIDLYPRFRGRGLRMVGISTDYRREDVVGFVEEHSVGFPQIFDGPDMLTGVTAELGVTRSPVALLVDSTGTVVSMGQSADALWSYLDAHLPE